MLFILIGLVLLVLTFLIPICVNVEKESPNTRIIRGCTQDPIQAIHMVREHILNKYNYTITFDNWKDNADCVMFQWLNSSEARDIGISNVSYVGGKKQYKDNSKEDAKWIHCEIKNGSTYIGIIIDLSVGVRRVYTIESDMMKIVDDKSVRELAYIITGYDSDNEKYIGQTVIDGSIDVDFI